LIPPLWRRRMHPIVEAYYDKGDVVPYAVPGALPEKYAAMVPEGWGEAPQESALETPQQVAAEESSEDQTENRITG
ncbi:MAG: hypothetical protein VW985_14215, partial [Gammaproteobacteria bacterium]